MTYQEKKQLRIDRLTRAAQMCRQQSEQMHSSAHQLAEIIPFGQPILIGHHSERRDRNYRNRIQRRFEKSFELQKKAEYYENRLQSALSNTAISSDDPEATTLLKEKLAKLEKRQETFRSINKIIKRKKGSREEKTAELTTLLPSWKPESIHKLFEVDFCGRVGIPDYELTNNNANIRRIKQRIEALSKREGQETTESTINGVRVVDNIEENRLQLFFPGKPAVEIRTSLKRAGFRWSPYAQCWQRMRSNNGTYQAKYILYNLSNT